MEELIKLPSFRLNFYGELRKLNGSGEQGWLQWSYGFLEGG